MSIGNFSSGSKVPRNAFEANVLKISTHKCDNDHEHLEGLVSCTPSISDAMLEDYLFESKTVQLFKSTRSYDTQKRLKVIKHASWNNLAMGFTGLPKLYSELGYGTVLQTSSTSTSMFKTCNNFGLCATQADAGYWFVNGIQERKRYVTDGSTVRVYRGSFNIVESKVYFAEPPRGNTRQRRNETNLPYVRSEFSGRTFLRRDYSTNMLFDDISDQFTGIGKTYTLTVQGINTTGLTIGNGILFINGVFQTPTTIS